MKLKCKHCQSTDRVRKEQFTRYGVKIGPFCVKCWHKVKICERCGKLKKFKRDARSTKGVSYYSDSGECLCGDCRKEIRPNIKSCKLCGCKRSIFHTIKGQEICDRCANSNYFKCEVCDDWHSRSVNFWNNEISRYQYPDIYNKTVGGLCKNCANVVLRDVKKVDVNFCLKCGKPTTDYFKNKRGECKPVCSRCVSSLFKCEDCNDTHLGAYQVRANGEVNSKKVCYKCYKNYYTCSYCKKRHHKSNGHFLSKPNGGIPVPSLSGKLRGKFACNTCFKSFVKCNRCDKDYPKSQTKVLKDKRYCESCQQFVAVCTVCKNVTEYKVHDSGMCRKCHAERYDEGFKSEWNWKPRFYKHSKGTSNVFFGLENEVSVQRGVSVNSRVGQIYLKWKEDEVYCVHDGSVTNGFEVVTHPRDFELIKSTDWTDLFPTGVIKHKSCGMHVHISRDSFSKSQLFKFIKFINDKPNFIRLIGQRPESHYCAKLSSKVSDVVKEGMTPVRYCRINLQNAATVELRFFANVITPENLLKNVEFLKALFDFTKYNKYRDCTVENFCSYVRENKSMFENLLKFITFYQLVRR